MDNISAIRALEQVAERLRGCGAAWVVGGSAGLALRGAAIDRPPRDLDLYADGGALPRLHERLADAALDGPAASETDRYRSVLSHYRIGGVLVELVGDFRVEARDSIYITEVDAVLYPAGDRWIGGGAEARLVPPGHELLFNLLRDRLDRAAAAAALIRRDPAAHEPALSELLSRNRIAEEVAAQAWRLVREGEEGAER